LVERLNGIEEVWGSNPHGSTPPPPQKQKSAPSRAFRLFVFSSLGLSASCYLRFFPLTPVSRVFETDPVSQANCILTIYCLSSLRLPSVAAATSRCLRPPRRTAALSLLVSRQLVAATTRLADSAVF
jgi:hypothetical protein